MELMGFEESLVGSVRPDGDFDFTVTQRAPSLVSVAILVDVNAAINIATLEQNADIFFCLLGVHTSPMA